MTATPRPDNAPLPDALKTYRCARIKRCPASEKIDPPQVCDECECHGHGPGYPCTIEGGCGHLHLKGKVDVGARISQERGLCLSCTAHVEDALTGLLGDYVELETLLGVSGDQMVSDTVSATRDLPVPLRVSIIDLQMGIVHEAVSWAEPVAERLGINWDTQNARDSRPGPQLQRALALLGKAVSVLLALPDQDHRCWRSGDWLQRDGVAGALELLGLHSLVRAVAGRSKLVHDLPAPCPRCDQLTLVRHDGDDHVQCEICRAQWPEEDYKRLCLVVADDYQDDAPPRPATLLHTDAQGTVRGRVHQPPPGTHPVRMPNPWPPAGDAQRDTRAA
jgi:hypothetical protein